MPTLESQPELLQCSLLQVVDCHQFSMGSEPSLWPQSVFYKTTSVLTNWSSRQRVSLFSRPLPTPWHPTPASVMLTLCGMLKLSKVYCPVVEGQFRNREDSALEEEVYTVSVSKVVERWASIELVRIRMGLSGGWG